MSFGEADTSYMGSCSDTLRTPSPKLVLIPVAQALV
jgi:hypothetical protein